MPAPLTDLCDGTGAPCQTREALLPSAMGRVTRRQVAVCDWRDVSSIEPKWASFSFLLSETGKNKTPKQTYASSRVARFHRIGESRVPRAWSFPSSSFVALSESQWFSWGLVFRSLTHLSALLRSQPPLSASLLPVVP